MDKVIELGIFFGAIFCLVIAVSLLFYKQIKVSFYFTFIGLVSTGILLLYCYFNIAGLYFNFFVLNHLYIPFVFSLGPSIYLLFRTIMNNLFQFKKQHIIFFLPSILIIIYILVSCFDNPNYFISKPTDFFNGGSRKLSENLMVIGFIGNTIYYFIISTKSLSIFSIEYLRNELAARVFLGLLVSLAALTISFILSYIFRDKDLLFLTAFSITILILMAYFFSNRFPELYQELENVIEEVKIKEGNQKSQLEGLNLKELHFDLIEIMNTDQLYLDEKLTLPKLAHELDINSHQLSEFLNRYLNINYAKFVNQFRIEKAIRLLLEDDGLSIIDTAYKVGFNSKATFNHAFKTIKNMSPTAYIRRQKLKRDNFGKTYENEDISSKN